MRTGARLGEALLAAEDRDVELVSEVSFNEYDGSMGSQVKAQDTMGGAAAVGMASAEDRTSWRPRPPTNP